MSNDTLQFICAFPVSGQYGPTVRFVIYPLLLLAILGARETPWLRTGTLSTIFTYCAIASIHQSAMATHSSDQVIDLDMFPAYHMTILALILGPSAMLQAKSLLDRPRLSIFGMVLLLIWTGVISFTVRVRSFPAPVDCVNDNGPVSSSNTSALLTCKSICPTLSLPMRTGQAAQNVAYSQFTAYDKRAMAIALTCLLTFYELITYVRAREGSAKLPVDSIPSYQPISNPDSEKEKTGSGRWLVKYLTPFFLLGWCVFAELRILRPLPQSEGHDAIGQWAPLVAILLVLTGAWFKGMLDKKVKESMPGRDYLGSDFRDTGVVEVPSPSFQKTGAGV